ncbi:MAG: putative phage tail protein [Pseudomonadota bacterium]
MSNRYVPRTLDDYTTAFLNLMPRGAAWNTAVGSFFYRLARGFAAQWARLDARAVTFLERESDPARAVEMLPDWERVTGLPDKCTPAVLTIPERQQAVVSKLRSRGGLSRAYFIELAASLGYEITITEFSPVVMGRSRFGDPFWRFGSPFVRFYWLVTVASPRITWFRFGLGVMGQDPHQNIVRAEDLECKFRDLKPDHTVLIFQYTGA